MTSSLKTPQSLIHKTDLCKGAITFRHSHFFTHSGGFGSLDQTGNRVDSGSYRIIDAHTLSITNTDFSDAIFHYRIFRDNPLTLDPVITASSSSRFREVNEGRVDAFGRLTRDDLDANQLRRVVLARQT